MESRPDDRRRQTAAGTSLTEPAPAARPDGAGEAVERLVGVMERLRSPDGCPWDREQTWRSLRRYVLEEAHELVDAVDRDDPDAVLEELGDVLLEVVFFARIAAEEGRFGMAEVASGVAEKLIRRHPHVFGGGRRAKDPDEALAGWEEVKAREKRAREPAGRRGPLDDLPPGLPALLFAVKALERAGSPDWTEPAPRSGHSEDSEDETGRRLFDAVVAAWRAGVDPEAALRKTVRARFADRPARPRR